MNTYFQLLKKTVQEWLGHEPFQHSAVIAYYTLFSLPSLMVMIISLVGYFFGKSHVQDQIIDELGEFIGSDTADSVEKLISNVNVQDDSVLTIIISLGILIFGATGAFFHLKKVMNTIWSVREKKSNPFMVVINRGISLGMVLVIGGLMVASIVITSLVTVLGQYISEFAPELTSSVLKGFNFLFSYVFIGLLFAAIFKLLPDVKVPWKITFAGAGFTTLLFLIAVYGLSIYFGQSNPTSVFGGASSIILIMMWVYYSCLVLFFGAEFTVQYAVFKKAEIRPNRFGEPAIVKELEELKKKQVHLKERKRIIRELAEDDGEA